MESRNEYLYSIENDYLKLMKLNYHYNVKNLYLFKIGNEFKD